MFLKSLFLLLIGALTPLYASDSLIEANRGQYSAEVKYLLKSGSVSTAITRSGFAFAANGERLNLRFDGADLDRCVPGSRSEGEANYLAGAVPVTHVPYYSSVECRDAYGGIDWVLRADKGSLEHDWRLAAGADPGKIALVLGRAAHATIGDDGALFLHSGKLSVIWKAPEAYQMVAGERRTVAVRYVVKGRRVSLATGPYTHSLPLIIDPVIDFSYVVNGNSDDRGLQAGVDGTGNVYLAGLTLSSDFATTSGAVQTAPVAELGGDYQVFVRKLSPDGSKVLYSTYLGITPFYSAHPLGMRVDSAGNVYLAANAFGQFTTGTQIASDGTVFVYKIAPAGDKLIYQNQVLPGFSYAAPVALAVDSAGDAYVGIGSGVIGISKIDATGQSQLYLYQATVSDYSGGLADLAVGGDGTLYVAGTTASGALVTTAGAFQTSATNPQDYHGYLIRLKADGSSPLYGTYIAGDFNDEITSVAVDSSGAAYAGGQTQSDTGLPGLQGTTLGVAAAPQSAGFVIKINAAGSTALYTALLPGLSVNALAVDSSGNAYAGLQHSAGNLAAAKIDPTGSKLLYYCVIPVGPAATVQQEISSIGVSLGLTLDASGAAYLAGSVEGLSMPNIAPPSNFPPNAFVLKIEGNPDQSDLQIQASGPQTGYPSVPTPILFTIANQGPAAAESVTFGASIQNGLITSCAASGQGVCGSGSGTAYFPSIPPGGSETVQLQVSPDGAAMVTVTATVNTVTSDVNLNNNIATATVDSTAAVQVTIKASLGFVINSTFSVTGGLEPGNHTSGEDYSFFYAEAGDQFQVYWPSPQESVYGPVVFANWQDGSTDNPRTFTAVGKQMAATANFSILLPFNAPYLTAAGVGNAASYAANGVSPGEFVAIGGFNLGMIASPQLSGGILPTTLGGATVTFDGISAPLVYTGPTQVNAIVPYEIAGHSNTTIVTTFGGASASVTVPVVNAVPALFTADASGSGQAAALNQDGSVNSPSNPANPGDVIVLYGTGEGLVTPTPVDGSTTGTPAATPQLPITVSIGGAPADVLYAAEAPGLAAGVIQINARIPAGLSYTHHTPVTWTEGGFTSQAGVTIAITDSPSPAPVFDPTVSNPFLTQIQISPLQIAADSGPAVITISGAGFTDGMVALWNNQPRPTTFISASTLRVNLTGDDLEIPQLGSLAVWDGAQTHAISQTAPLLAYLPLLSNDLVYDSTRDKIYAAVAAKAATHPSSIAVLNPETGRVEQWYALDAEPVKLALSPDNQYLFVAVLSAIERIDLSSWSVDLRIPLTPDPNFGAIEASSMVNLGAEDNSLAVSFIGNLNPPYLGTGVFDGATLRPTVTPARNGPEYLLGGPDPQTLYGSDGNNFYTLQITPQGVTVAGGVTGLMGGGNNAVYFGGLVYSGSGRAIDPAGPTIVQTWSSSVPELIAPFPDLSKVLLLGNGTNAFAATLPLGLYDASSGALLWSINLPAQGYIGMIGWGSNGVALRSSLTGIALFQLNLGQ